MINLNRLAIYCMLFFLIACIPIVRATNAYGEKEVRFNELQQVPEKEWNALAGKKIFFGHQSVGYNIIDGMRTILERDHEVSLNIIEGKRPSLFQHPVFAHVTIGTNGKPLTKFNDFEKILNSGVGNQAEISFMKLCYVDINKQTEIKSLFENYVRMVERLQQKYPKLVIVHFTVPLRVSMPTWKTRLKGMLGKEIWEFADNIQRNAYNQMIRAKYGSSGHLFDLAALESQGGDGRRYEFFEHGIAYEMLAPNNSTDGGHLNKRASVKIAKNLLIFLSSIH